MYREILTKAVIAKGNKNIIDEKIVNTSNKISKALGCWVINHKFTPYINNQNIYIKGSYQVNLWYGINDNTSSFLEIVDYEFDDLIPYNFTLEKFVINEKNEIISNEKTPINCSKMSFEDNIINLTIERSYEIDIIGESKIKVKVDDVIIDQMIDTNYVNKNNDKQQSN